MYRINNPYVIVGTCKQVFLRRELRKHKTLMRGHYDSHLCAVALWCAGTGERLKSWKS